jgi:hypothetical protein
MYSLHSSFRNHIFNMEGCIYFCCLTVIYSYCFVNVFDESEAQTAVVIAIQSAVAVRHIRRRHPQT